MIIGHFAIKVILFTFTLLCSKTSANNLHHLIKKDDHRLSRVIGGEIVTEGSWPWLVSLKAKVPDIKVFGFPVTHQSVYCSASLLNERWILTAAHCFDAERFGEDILDPDNWHARLGEIEINTNLVDDLQGFVGNALDIDDWRVWNIHGDQIILHPEYNPHDIYANDIALLRLSEAVPVGNELHPEIDSVRLPDTNDAETFPTDNAPCIMKGWGCTTGGGTVSNFAMQVELPKINDGRCYRFWGVDTTTQICAGYNLGSKGICSGDSGGPLVCPGEDGSWIQAGVASFAAAEDPGEYPGVFIRVGAYLDWIHQHIDY